MLKRCFVWITLVLFFLGCSGKVEKTHYTEIQVTGVAKDFKMPRALFDKIEADLLLETKVLQPVYLFLPLTVVLNSENLDVVPRAPIKFEFQNGGGSIDLKNHIKGQGSFYLSFPPEQFVDKPVLEHLYYVSDSPQKKIDEENFGLGCGKWVDIKSKFSDLQKIDFLKLNTTGLRYLYVLSGQYIFIFRKLNQFYITHLNILDSRYPDLSCSSLYSSVQRQEQK